jgi:hypothetical protein
MPVFSIYSYQKPIKKPPHCKAGHLAMCSKKPNCGDCGLLKLQKLNK